MTNKDYKRLSDTGIPTITAENVYNRLYELENAIENNTLLFLPCKVGDKFWCLAEYYSISDGWVDEIVKHTVSEIRILSNAIYLYDENDDEYDTSDVILYMTKEDAEKALRELCNGK